MIHTDLKSITDVKGGIIVHQVNCQNAMGAGVARALYEKYPRIKSDYHRFCSKTKNPKELLGKMLYTNVKENLWVISLFTQEFYGNSRVTGKCYTDEPLLVAKIIDICKRHENLPIYIPEYIGCGLAGGNWIYVKGELEKAELKNLGIVSLKK